MRRLDFKATAQGLAAVAGLLVFADWTAQAHATEIFTITAFADPPSSLTYYSGFSGSVGTTSVWPAEMGWQGDQIDIAFTAPSVLSPNLLGYRFEVDITNVFTQNFPLSIQVGPSPSVMTQVHYKQTPGVGTIAAGIPVARLRAGQTNWLRIRGIGVQVGAGQPAGIRWNRWSLQTVESVVDLTAARSDQLNRLANYVVAAIQPSGLVRDSLTLNPADAPFHPATPDAAGFALLALCAADHLELLPDAEQKVEAILSAYSGHTPGVTPQRSADGHWVHFMNINTGLYAGGGWDSSYSPIGAALLVAGAQFARNHFVANGMIAGFASELTSTTDFNAAIHPSLDGRVYLRMSQTGGGLPGEAHPWNEYMLVVSLALREADNARALAVAPFWLDPENVPVIALNGIATPTDNPFSFAPAFWVQQQHFFNTDFAANPGFESFFFNHRQADDEYCNNNLGQAFRYGLTAGVSPSGYTVDKIFSHQNVFSPEAVTAWGDLETTLQFLNEQPPTSNPRYRYGLVRKSSTNLTWIPFDAGLVDHTFLMLGFAESVDPLFFIRRQAGQTDADADGIGDAFDNCMGLFNPDQADANLNSVGDSCEGAVPAVTRSGLCTLAVLLGLAGAAVCSARHRQINGVP